MTSIAVTASMCASASEVALLVASFMPVFSLNLGATDRGAGMRNTVGIFTRNTPRRVFACIESPLGEHRLCQVRTVLRRQFDSRVSRGRNCLGKIVAKSSRR
jgi:hypothetical protein